MSKYNKVNLYGERAESFVKRTILLLEKAGLASSYDEEVNEHLANLIRAGLEECDAYDEAMDFSASLADEYLLLIDGILSAILAAYYHLWERDIKELCKDYLRYHPVSCQDKLITEKGLQSFQYDKLKDLLVFWGVREELFKDVNLLRLIANTSKHGLGQSARELLTTDGRYYNKLVMLCDLDIDLLDSGLETDMLNIDDIKHFGEALISFWKRLEELMEV